MSSIIFFMKTIIAIEYLKKKILLLFLSHRFIAKIFLMNWTWISNFTEDYKDIGHTNGTQSSHTIIRTTTNPLMYWLIGSPIKTLVQHRWSSTADKLHNQLAECPNSTLCSKQNFSQVHIGGHTQLWSSSAGPDACFCSTKKKCKLAARAEQGRNREDSWNK